MSTVGSIRMLPAKQRHAAFFITFLLGFTAIWHTTAKSAGIEGVWASKSSACADIFAKSKKGAVFFRKNSEAFGSGFIIEGDRIRGKMFACKIVRRNEE